MTARRFIPWPDKRLRTAAAPVAEITPEITALWEEMIGLMDAMPGVGLAAPQIGVMLQVAVVDASERRDRRIRLANPEVLQVSRRDFVGLEATSVQHQIDHLAGRMYFHHLSKTKRDMLLRRARKHAR